GVRVSGCTAHFVTEQLDAGPVILQDVFHIRVGEDALEDVKARGRALEAKVLSQAVQLYLNDQLVVKDKKVIFRPGRFRRRGGRVVSAPAFSVWVTGPEQGAVEAIAEELARRLAARRLAVEVLDRRTPGI